MRVRKGAGGGGGGGVGGGDVTRICSDEIGQNLLSRHFLASFHVCDTIEGFRLVRVPHMVKLLSKLIYSRVIAVSLLGRDKFPHVS